MDFERQRRIMVDSQIRVNDVSDPALVAAFMDVPREKFVPKPLQSSAYAELEIPTGEDRAMWTPRDLGKMLLALSPKPSDLALVIGAGSGYSAAVLSGVTETVIAVEDTEDAVNAVGDRFAEIGADQAVAALGDLKLGLPKQAPFDIILVAGMVQVTPQAWFDQLNEGGRLGVVEQAGRGIGRARIYTKTENVISGRDAFECCPPTLPGFEQAPTFTF